MKNSKLLAANLPKARNCPHLPDFTENAFNVVRRPPERVLS